MEELYEDVLEKEPEDIVDYNDKKYRAWEKKLHKSIGWIAPLIQGNVIAEENKDGKLKPVSGVLDEKIVWDVNLREGGMTCQDQEHAEIISLLVQINERLKKVEKVINGGKIK